MPAPAGDDLEADFVDEEHILTFQRALEAEEDFDTIDTPYGNSTSEPSSPRTRVRKIAALSDFAPIRQKVNRKSRFRRKNREWSFHIVRWPFLTFLFIVMFAQFGLYIIIRQIVNAVEWLFAWRGRKGALRKQLRSAKTYQEWKDAAKEMDLYLGLDKWKRDDEDPYYDWKLLKKVRRSLRTMREADDARGVLGILEICMRSNFAASESSRLYSETYLGTKNLIESYINDIEASLAYIRQTPKLSVEEKRRFFRGVNRNLGASALCLSGGATFGYYHFGVVKAFLDAGLLPRVIAGTSCGSLIAALVGTRTDAELRKLLVPELADRITACEDPFSVWMERVRNTGARFDTVQWARKATFFTRGSLTFREAYALTGRVLNVSVIPFDQHSPTKLLNYLTAPDCVIWSAIIASAAVPGILNPVVLMQKTKSGSIIPWNWGSRFKDGSLRVDVPLQSLNLLFNVNHSIVSQVNPHVHLFFFAPRGSAGKPVAKGKGWRGGFILSAAEQLLKHELTKNFKVIRDLELLPQLLGQDWSSVFLQRFDGTVTIWPRTRFKDWIRILSDPDRDELERMLRVGQLATWPKLHMISNRVRLEREILRGRKAVRQALQAQSKALHEKEYTAPEVDRPIAGPPAVAPGPSEVEQREQLAIESDAETGFATGSQRFFRRGHRHSNSASPAGTSTDRPALRISTERAERGNTSSSGRGDEERGDTTPKELRSHEDPLVSPIRRRKWASSLLRVDDAHRQVEDEEDYFAGMQALAPKRSKGHLRTPTAPVASTSSGMQRGGSSRTQPGSPIMGRRSPLLVRNQTHQQFTVASAQPPHSSPSPSFFERLRTRSFTAFPRPWLVGRAGPSEAAAAYAPNNVSREGSFAAGGTEDSWSSDSSSEDEWSNTHLGQSVAGLETEAAHSFVGLSAPEGESMDEDSPMSDDEQVVRRKAEDILMRRTADGEGEDHYTQDPKTGDLADNVDDLPQQDEDA